jgi:hypothetical protein
MAGPGDNTRNRSKPGADNDAFKRAVTACIRAIAGDNELEVAFAKDKPALAGNRARLPDLPRKPTANDLAVTRGIGDSIALRKARHDASIHTRLAPEGREARAVFDALEQARVEAIGSRAMQGVADNIGSMLEDKYAKANLADVADQADAFLGRSGRRARLPASAGFSLAKETSSSPSPESARMQTVTARLKTSVSPPLPGLLRVLSPALAKDYPSTTFAALSGSSSPKARW